MNSFVKPPGSVASGDNDTLLADSGIVDRDEGYIDENHTYHGGQEHEKYHHKDPGPHLMLESKYEDYEVHFWVTLLVVIGAMTVIMFKELPICRKITHSVPESSILILIGLATGSLLHYLIFKEEGSRFYNAESFFNYLLPPIILDAAYRLYSREFMTQIQEILLLALLGTTFNIFAIGFSLWGVYGIHNDIDLTNILCFASIVAAVDPVAVLAVFNEVGVQQHLYVLIFGESLLNDGVTVVFFETLHKLSGAEEVAGITYLYALLSFLTVAMGGLCIGILLGAVSAIITKHTHMESEVFEPVIVIGMAYFAFLCAQILSWSGIMSLIGCGLVQRRYAYRNLHHDSVITVSNATESLSCVMETLIFIILGESVFGKVSDSDDWNIVFISWTILFCTIYRFISTFLFCALMNTYRLHRLTYQHQFIIAFGGLRGAVSFAMAGYLDGHSKHYKLFLTTTLAVIFFTVFLQGVPIKYLVIWLGMKEEKYEETFNSAVLRKVANHVVAGMETILGGGSRLHADLENLEDFDRKHIRKHLTKKSDFSGFSAMLKNKEMEEVQNLKKANNAMLWGILRYARERVNERDARSKELSDRTDRLSKEEGEELKKSARSASRSAAETAIKVVLKDELEDDSVKQRIMGRHQNDGSKRKKTKLKPSEQEVKDGVQKKLELYERLDKAEKEDRNTWIEPETKKSTNTDPQIKHDIDMIVSEEIDKSISNSINKGRKSDKKENVDHKKTSRSKSSRRTESSRPASSQRTDSAKLKQFLAHDQSDDGKTNEKKM